MLLFFTFRFEYLISGPKSSRDFRETGPWALHKSNPSRDSWGDLSRDRYIACLELCSPAGNLVPCLPSLLSDQVAREGLGDLTDKSHPLIIRAVVSLLLAVCLFYSSCLSWCYWPNLQICLTSPSINPV